MAKKIIIAAIILVIVTAGSFIAYVSLTMRPIDSTQINDGIYAVRDGFVNFFLIKGDKGFIAVDAGVSPESAIEGLKGFDIDPSEVHTILLTHSDSDHAGGIEAFPNAELYIPDLEVPMIEGKDFRRFFGGERSGVSPISTMEYTVLATGALFEIDGVSVQAVSVPGHSSGSTAFVIDDLYAFIGDMALISRGHLASLPSFLTNDTKQAEQTAADFEKNFGYLKFIATAHDGILSKEED